MTALDPALCARLVSEAKTHHEVTQREQPPCDGPDCKGGEHFLPCAAKVHRNAVVDAWIWKEAHLRDLADQLEAALAEVERLKSATCRACDGRCERLHNDGLMHRCTVCGGTERKP